MVKHVLTISLLMLFFDCFVKKILMCHISSITSTTEILNLRMGSISLADQWGRSRVVYCF